eukprot:TRINITY_DN13628_c0_g1_i2.p1 TRINITY_DN13628_c0_g1~~TRINITY_DN13628_c0_g1_i2.p1  ORF type:complete len:832 (+),score=260.85 TRINITY_DN13628_c0_g1_i2:32-2527(+)
MKRCRDADSSSGGSEDREDMEDKEDRDHALLLCDDLPVPRPKRQCTRGPVWVSTPTPSSNQNGAKLAMLLVETFGPEGAEAVRFCTQCADPIDRCNRFHTYAITKTSLRRYEAGIEDAIEKLKHFTRDTVGSDIKQLLLKELVQPCGVSIVVGRSCYVESGSLEELGLLHKALKSQALSKVEWCPHDIRSNAVPYWMDLERWEVTKQELAQNVVTPEKGKDGTDAKDSDESKEAKENILALSDNESAFSWEDEAEAEEELGQGQGPCLVSDMQLLTLACCIAVIRAKSGAYKFYIKNDAANDVKKIAREKGLRCWMEWDLAELEDADEAYHGPGPRFTPRTPRWTITAVRSHQEAALNAAFPAYITGSRLKSGVVALPCGAGKTMVGVLISAAIRAPCLVLCTSGIAVEQWVAQYGRWASLHTVDGRVARFTGKVKDKVDNKTQIVVTTYNMLLPRKRGSEGGAAVKSLLSQHWGAVVLDEVHVLPAESCSNCVKSLKARAFIGLTATLVREDNKIDTLDHLIGPRLHEAEWGDLVKLGVLATVKCIEVRCTLTSEFAAEYVKAKKASLREFLGCLNPKKLQATLRIIDHHEARGDKTLVFSDSLFVLRQLQQLLKRPAVCGSTSLKERLQLLSDFQSGRRLNTLIISRIGDCAIDLPAASVIIQVSSHYGSRRQEAQRLGRILRPKGSLIHPVPFVREDKYAETPNALFYSIVSQDTSEALYSRRRQTFLEEQGYAYQQVNYTDDDCPLLGTKAERVDLLAKALSTWKLTKGRGEAQEQRTVVSELQEECDIERSPSPERVLERRAVPLSTFSMLGGPGSLVYGEWELGK